jgi:hypothetical protein
MPACTPRGVISVHTDHTCQRVRLSCAKLRCRTNHVKQFSCIINRSYNMQNVGKHAQGRVRVPLPRGASLGCICQTQCGIGGWCVLLPVFSLRVTGAPDQES